MKNTNCYTFYEYNHNQEENGLFDKSIDATYVINLKNNGRFESVINQLNQYKPTKKIYILLNEGYKNCEKNLPKQCVLQDLIHCYLTIYEHANNNSYDNILILEDDFIFNKKIKNTEIIDDINNFLNYNKNKSFLYFLGGIPILSISVKKNHYKPLFIATTHCVVYSKQTRNFLLKNKNKIYNSNEGIDLYLSDNINNKYHYKYPLCYQTFPLTDSQKEWVFFKRNKIINDIVKRIYILLIHTLKLDIQCEPGYTIIYTFSILLFYIIMFFILYIFYKNYKITNKLQKININKIIK